MKLYIDMDGVLCDFVGGVLNLIHHVDPWPEGEYDICKVVGFNIWPTLERQGILFWTDLKKTDEADQIMTQAEKFDYYICSSPSNDHLSAAGKLYWLKANYPQVYKERRFILTPHKHLLANPSSVLIDDSDEQIQKWNTAGGVGLLLPRPWNKLHGVFEPLKVIGRIMDLMEA